MTSDAKGNSGIHLCREVIIGKTRRHFMFSFYFQAINVNCFNVLFDIYGSNINRSFSDYISRQNKVG